MTEKENGEIAVVILTVEGGEREIIWDIIELPLY